MKEKDAFCLGSWEDCVGTEQTLGMQLPRQQQQYANSLDPSETKHSASPWKKWKEAC